MALCPLLSKTIVTPLSNLDGNVTLDVRLVEVECKGQGCMLWCETYDASPNYCRLGGKPE